MTSARGSTPLEATPGAESTARELLFLCRRRLPRLFRTDGEQARCLVEYVDRLEAEVARLRAAQWERDNG